MFPDVLLSNYAQVFHSNSSIFLSILKHCQLGIPQHSFVILQGSSIPECCLPGFIISQQSFDFLSNPVFQEDLRNTAGIQRTAKEYMRNTQECIYVFISLCNVIIKLSIDLSISSYLSIYQVLQGCLRKVLLFRWLYQVVREQF